jgi:hypothetical protein
LKYVRLFPTNRTRVFFWLNASSEQAKATNISRAVRAAVKAKSIKTLPEK